MEKNDLDAEKQARGAVVKHLKESALAGLVLTAALACVQLAGPGGVQSFVELKKHVLYVHPLLWALTLVVVCFVLAFRGIELGPDLSNWLVKPILRFVAHVFGAAVGAIPVIAGVALFAGPAKGSDFVVMGVAFCLSLLNATMALTGIEAAPPTGLRVKKHVQVVALVLFLAGLGGLFGLSRSSAPSDQSIPEFAHLVVEKVSSVLR